MNKKYEFTGEIKTWFGRTLYQIRATVKFGTVENGELGGWIEKEENLSQDGNAWVCDNAQVYGDAQVCDNALVCDNAQVCGDAQVCDNARVCDNAQVCGQTHWLCTGPIGSRDDFTTFFRAKGAKIYVKCGCFRGDIDAFALKIQATHGDGIHAKAYMAAIELAKARIDLSGEDSEE